MTSELSVRPYQPGDEKQILDLFQKSYGHDLDEQVWAWRFRDSASGHGIIDLAWDHEILAAHYAVSLVAVRIQGRDWMTGLSGTTMTHPGYRGQGLFPILARSTYSRMAEAGMGMVWGFPNTLSHRGFIKDLGWADIYEIPTLRLALPARRPLPKPDIIELPGFDDRFNRLWDRVKDNYQILVRRDCAHLQWRYANNPAERYRIIAIVNDGELAGYAVLKKYQKEIQVVDILTDTDTEFGVQLVSHAAHLALKESLSAVSLWLNVTHPLHRDLEKLGFQNCEPITYVGGLVLQDELNTPEIYHYRNWYLTMGDSDVF